MVPPEFGIWRASCSWRCCSTALLVEDSSVAWGGNAVHTSEALTTFYQISQIKLQEVLHIAESANSLQYVYFLIDYASIIIEYALNPPLESILWFPAGSSLIEQDNDPDAVALKRCFAFLSSECGPLYRFTYVVDHLLAVFQTAGSPGVTEEQVKEQAKYYVELAERAGGAWEPWRRHLLPRAFWGETVSGNGIAFSKDEFHLPDLAIGIQDDNGGKPSGIGIFELVATLHRGMFIDAAGNVVDGQSEAVSRIESYVLLTEHEGVLIPSCILKLQFPTLNYQKSIEAQQMISYGVFPEEMVAKGSIIRLPGEFWMLSLIEAIRIQLMNGDHLYCLCTHKRADQCEWGPFMDGVYAACKAQGLQLEPCLCSVHRG